MVADCILTLEQPFPGDNQYCVPDIRPELRFHIHRDKDTCDFILSDRLTESRLRVARCLMENPDFDISHWYAEQRAHELGLTNEITHHHCMGKAISIVATKLLTDGIASSYPSIDYNLGPEQQFQVLQISVRDPEHCRIKDFYLGKDIDIPKLWLEDPEFDLVGWYRRYIDRHSLFEHQYCSAHLELASWVTRDNTEQPISPEETISDSEFDLDELLENNNAGCDDMPHLDPLLDDSESDEEGEDPFARPRTYGLEDNRVFIKKCNACLPNVNHFQGMDIPWITHISQEALVSWWNDEIGASSVFTIEYRGLKPTYMSHGYTGIHSPSVNGSPRDAL